MAPANPYIVEGTLSIIFCPPSAITMDYLEIKMAYISLSQSENPFRKRFSYIKQIHLKDFFPSLRIINISTRHCTTVIIVANDSVEGHGGGSGVHGGSTLKTDWRSDPVPHTGRTGGPAAGFVFSQSRGLFAGFPFIKPVPPQPAYFLFLVVPEAYFLEDLKLDPFGRAQDGLLEPKYEVEIVCQHRIRKGSSYLKETDLAYLNGWRRGSVNEENDKNTGRGDGDEKIGKGIDGGQGGGHIPDIDWESGPTPPIGISRGTSIGFGFSQASGSVKDREESSNGQGGGSGTGSVSEESGGSKSSARRERNEGISMRGGGNEEEGDDEDEGRDVDLESGRRVRKSRHMRLVSIFLSVVVQSTAAVITLHFVGQSSRARKLFFCVLVANLVSFICHMALLWPSRYTNSMAVDVLGKVGSATAALGFLFMMAINLPLWLIVLACFALMAIMVLSFIP